MSQPTRRAGASGWAVGGASSKRQADPERAVGSDVAKNPTGSCSAFHRLYFLEQFWVYSKTEKKVLRGSLHPCPHTQPPHYRHPHRSGRFLTGEPTLTRYLPEAQS